MKTTDSPPDRIIIPFSVLADGITIRGRIFVPARPRSAKYPALIICHGVPGSVAARPDDDPGYDALAEEFASLGVAAVFFNFRGCGDSGGDFDMLGWARDLEKVLEETLNTPRIDSNRVMVLGFSGGGAAAIYVASANPSIHSLAVVGTPAHFRLFEADPEDIVQDFRNRGIIRDQGFPPEVNRWVGGFEEIEPQRWIALFRGKRLLVLHGDADELIPVEHAQELFVRAPAGKAELFVVPGGEHRLRLDPRCVAKLKEWFVASVSGV